MFTLQNRTSVNQADVSILYAVNQINGFARQQASTTLRQSKTGQTLITLVNTTITHSLNQVPTSVKVFKAGIDITAQFTVVSLTATEVVLFNNGATVGASGTVRFYGYPPVLVNYDSPNGSYVEMLYELMTESAAIGLMHIQADSTDQLNKMFTIKQHNVRGKKSENPIIPRVNPFQHQSKEISLYIVWLANGYTEMVLSQLKANESITITLYPIERSSLLYYLGLSWDEIEYLDGVIDVTEEVEVKLNKAS